LLERMRRQNSKSQFKLKKELIPLHKNETIMQLQFLAIRAPRVRKFSKM